MILSDMLRYRQLKHGATSTPVLPRPPEAAVWTLDSLRGRPLPEPDAVVYMLAFARQQPFYVNMASDIASAYAVRNAIYRAQQRRYGRDGMTPLYCFYFECHASDAMAEARCARIKTMPHAWQRQLIDRFNAE